jgi:hypothetical protein
MSHHCQLHFRDSDSHKEPICVVNGSDRKIEVGSLTQRQANRVKVSRGAQILNGVQTDHDRRSKGEKVENLVSCKFQMSIS